MNRERYSYLAHATMRYCNPVSAKDLDHACDLAAPDDRTHALDIGSGKGELLIRLAERFGSRGLGIDRSPFMHADAVQSAAERGVAARVRFEERDAREWVERQADGAFDFVACLGAGYGISMDLNEVLVRLARLARRGGHVLWGEGYWRQPPPQEYLDALGASASDYGTHAEHEARGASAGLSLVWSCKASDDEWLAYESAYSNNIERFVAAHADDPDAAAMLKRSRDWSALVQAHGRDTLGFGVYLFRVA